MGDQPADHFGPHGDSARHRKLEELQAGLRALPARENDVGRLALIVRRDAGKVRATPERVVLTPEEGVPNDAWHRNASRDVEAQMAVMRREVAELIANGQSLTLFGDNLFVDFNISAANLPTGTRLRVGAALIEVSPKPHNGCMKFKVRFGQDAFDFVQDKPTRDQNLRGIYWKVIVSGEVAVGSIIQVVSRPPGPSGEGHNKS